MFERRNLMLLIRMNMLVLFSIMFIKLMVSVNPSLEEPFDYWWMMLMPNVAYPVGIWLSKFENKKH